MLLDLIRAVPVALLVGLVPGYFWARCLAATDDLAERLAYAIALSVTLVPAVALIFSSILGTGVTTTVSIISVVLVFAAGLAARLLFGAAKGSSRPLAPLPPAPDIATLVPLCLALLLALGTFFGLLGGWAMIPTAALIVLSGVLYWLSMRRRGETGPEETQDEASPTLVYGLLSVALLLALARGYLGPVLNGWPFPRGVDRYEHAIMTSMMAEGGSTESFMLYPPGFHALSAMISNLSGLEPMALFPALAPALLALTSLSSYALAARLWGRTVGVAAAFLSGPVLGGAYLHFVEARYPNFVGEQIIIILAVAALIGAYATPTIRAGLLLALLGSSAVFYHQIAGYVMAVLLAVVALFFLPYLLLRHRRTGIFLLGSLALLFVLAAAFAWDTYDLPDLVAGLFGGSGTGRGGDAVAMAIGTKPANHPTYLLVTITAPVLWLGLFGAMMLLPNRAGGNAPARLAHLTLIVWAALLFVGSQTSYSGFPDRFDRDLGAPLALLAAPALVLLLRASPRLTPSRAALAASLFAALLSAGLLVVQTTRNLEQASGPSERPRDRPAPPQVAAAGSWLGENNGGGSIVATPYLDYVPSRGMLAMGGYTKMQSYDYARILRARDLPPFGEGPLLDALWVLKHPTGGKTERIMRENDIRYVVFHKRYPGISWLPYAQQKDLYRIAYQNESVVIFEPRDT
ncbi:hypothetical protein GBA63_01200 [Rubrobacter tropicus]|uniref:Glycosyltransferase RgtA/B/C/D-like domain-containing protein n=1 Tax=Rubrobacter tropicus TaxID=2653851 RepID=A0A6G8Q4H3_9ACTN|nr:hypothetical protein [Rubrobacter tropicus]QIN81394.1 hypothetical protein GBA63_01200 [Rubrobacter tropicus]